MAPTASTRYPSTPEQARSSRVCFRRALTLFVMTLLLPGSAQLVAGNRRVGRFVLRVWFAFLGTAGLVVLLAWVWPGTVSGLLFSPLALGVVRVLLVVGALGWAALLIDTWRIGNPLGLQRRQRSTVFLLSSALCVVIPGALLFGSQLVSVQRSFIVDVFGSGVVSDTEAGRYNVLLMGGDAGKSRVGMRPDSITVASIDEETGRTVLFGLPRNLEDVPFPDDTPMRDAYPSGYDCDDCYLNSIYTWAHENEEKFPEGIDDVGIWATTKAVEETTGLKINYYATVDLAGFERLVDSVGGVTLKVPERIPMGGIGGPIFDWIEPGRQHLDGFQTLWFARSRANSDDYSRMARQKCVMTAMLTQLNPTTVLTNFQEIADAGKQVVTTDVPAEELSGLLDLSTEARELPMRSVSFVPPKIETYDPDYTRIRDMVDTAVDKAEAADDTDSKTQRAKPKKRSPRTGAPNNSNDLDDSCG